MEMLLSIALYVGIAAVTIALCVAFGMGVRDPAKAQPETHTGTIDRLFLRISGASINGYPCMELICDDGKTRRLDLRTWELYDELWPGDRVEVTHRLRRAETVEVIARGKEYEAQLVSHTAEAIFTKSDVKRRTYTRVLRWAQFTLNTGEIVELRVPLDWTVPEKGTAGILAWHGNRLDGFERE